MMFTTGAAMMAIIAAVAVAALQGPHGHSLKSGDRTESTLVTTTTHVTTTEKPDTTATTVAETEASDDGLGDDAAPAISDPAVDNRPPATEAPTSASQVPATTTHKSSSGTSSSQPSQTTGTTQPKSPSPRKTETSVGGTVTVKLDGNRLEIVDIEAAEGFDAHKNDHYRSRIDVTFTSHNHTSYITFTTSDGKIYSSTHESDTTVPGDNFGGGWGDGGGGGGGGD
jgi:hypothetical protein